MKVLHINALQTGGAALCAIRINEALVRQGVESRMLFAEGNVPDGVDGAIAEKDPYHWDGNLLLLKVRHLINRFPWVIDADKMKFELEKAKKSLTSPVYAHHACSHYVNIAHHPLVDWADIIHLHWVPEFVDYPTFFKRIKKPIVWTLHDMFPILGVMHFESKYTVRPHCLDEVDALCKRIKVKGLSEAKEVFPVAISSMMLELISASEIYNGFSAKIIHNGVDTNIFKPEPLKIGAMAEFVSALSDNTTIFMFSSYFIWDERKGLKRVISAIEKIESSFSIDVALIVVGGKDMAESFPEQSFPIFCTGWIKDQIELAGIYSSVDFFINASYEEAFAQTPLESMSCGTPVISTPCSGASDLIRPFNGVVCDGFDVDSLTEGIRKALECNYDRKRIRQYMIDEYDYSKIANEYIDLYNCVFNSVGKQ